MWWWNVGCDMHWYWISSMVVDRVVMELGFVPWSVLVWWVLILLFFSDLFDFVGNLSLIYERWAWIFVVRQSRDHFFNNIVCLWCPGEKSRLLAPHSLQWLTKLLKACLSSFVYLWAQNERKYSICCKFLGEKVSCKSFFCPLLSGIFLLLKQNVLERFSSSLIRHLEWEGLLSVTTSFSEVMWVLLSCFPSIPFPFSFLSFSLPLSFISFESGNLSRISFGIQ